MALPAIEPAVEPTAEPMTLDQNPPPLDVAELLTVWLMTVVFFFTTVVRFGAELFVGAGREKDRPPLNPRPPRASAAVETKKATAMAATIAFFIGNPRN